MEKEVEVMSIWIGIVEALYLHPAGQKLCMNRVRRMTQQVRSAQRWRNDD